MDICSTTPATTTTNTATTTTSSSTTTTEVGMDNTRLQILQTFIWQAFDAIQAPSQIVTI